MESKPIEEMFLESAAPAVARDEVRQWVVHEKHRMSRRKSLVVASSLLFFVAMLSGGWLLLDQQVNEIRKLVDRQPNGVIKNLEEVTWELCNEPPAGYFVQQLTRPRGTGGVSSLTSF